MRSLKIIPLIFVLLVLWFSTDLLHAQTDPDVSYLRYDVELTLKEDGDLHVREIQQVHYEGQFSEGFAEIPLQYVTAISDIKVLGGTNESNLIPFEINSSGPGSFSSVKEGDNLYIEWEYDETSPGDELTFVVEYVVEVGLWIYPEVDILEWRAVASNRSGLTVPASRVIINLPFSFHADKLIYSAFGPEYIASTKSLAEGRQIIFETSEPLLDGTAFQVFVEMPHGYISAAAQPWQILEDQAELVYRIPEVEVDLYLNEEGNLKVIEKQTVAVEEGTLYEGFRRYSWLYLESIDGLRVSENDVQFDFVEETPPLSCEDCFTMSFENRRPYWISYSKYLDQIKINEGSSGGGAITWRVLPLIKGEETTFTLEFEAGGVIGLEDGQQRLRWMVLPGYDVPVEQTTVRLFLPNKLGLEDVEIEGEGSVRAADDHILITLDQPAGEWAISVVMPIDATHAAKPVWQNEMEVVFAEAEQARIQLARERLFFRSIRLFTTVLIVLGIFAAWYLAWSRKVREIRGQYRTTPPSDLAPGIVAYLVEEKVSPRGVLATLFHLATIGLIRIDLSGYVGLKRLSEKEAISGESMVVTPIGEKVHIDPHIAFLYNSLSPILPKDEFVPLDTIVKVVQPLLPQLYAIMSQDLVIRYHKNGGMKSKSRFMRFGVFGVVAILFIGYIFIRNYWYRLFITRNPESEGFVVAAVIFIFVVLAQMIVRRQRSKTLVKAGREEAKRWLGFKAYLHDIQQFGELEEAQEILDRYFDYAVALGVDERFLEQVRVLGGTTPVWMQQNGLNKGIKPSAAVRRYRPWYRRGSWSFSPLSKSHAFTLEMPDVTPDSKTQLQQVSDKLVGSLSSANRSMVTMLNSAVGDIGEAVAVEIDAFGNKTKMDWEPGTPVEKIIGDIMLKSQTIRPPRPTSSAGGGFRGGSGGSRFRSSSSNRSRSSRSSRGGSRRSGGGGRRGFR